MNAAGERQAPCTQVDCRSGRRPLTVVQTIEQVIARDLAGDPDWQLTSAARQWLSVVMHQLTPGEGRGR